MCVGANYVIIYIRTMSRMLAMMGSRRSETFQMAPSLASTTRSGWKKIHAAESMRETPEEMHERRKNWRQEKAGRHATK